MNIEFEAVFSPVNRDEMHKKIKAIGGKCTKVNTLMKRVVFENPLDLENSFLRIRDEGGKITCCLKTEEEGNKHIASVREYETQVDDFETMQNIFLGVGLKQKAYQETYREIWEIPGEIEFMIDEWPGMKPFIEIEGVSEEKVRKYSEKLGFDYNDALFGTVDQVYKKELGITAEYINQLEVITFEKPPKIV